MQSAPNLAAQKIRRWRKSQQPAMNGADFGRKFKISPATVYRIETGSRVPRAETIALLEAAGICSLQDFRRPPEMAESESGGG